MIEISYAEVNKDNRISRRKLKLEENKELTCSDEFFAKLLVALASNSAGDATAFYEWFDPIVYPKGNILQANVRMNTVTDKTWCLHGEDYSGLVDFPKIFVSYKGQAIGPQDAKYKFYMEDVSDGICIKFKVEQVASTSVFA